MPKAGYAEWETDDAYDMFVERSPRRARRKPLPWLRLILLSSISIAGLAYFAQHRQEARPSPVVRSGGVPASVLIAPAPAWQPIAPSPALYAFEKPLGSMTAEAREHTSGAREDTLVFGKFGDPRHARITLAQDSSEPARSFFVDIVRRAAGAGLAVSRNGQSRMVSTKFGPMEVASMTLTGGAEQECQAFRFSEPDTGFGFQGWLCGSGAPVADDTQLACFIDGMTLTGGTSPSLKAVFARAERNRIEACGAAARTASIPVKAPRRP